MAIYDNLPVYKTSYDLLLLIFTFLKNMTKEYKYTIGEKLKNETMELITNIYRANSVLKKENYIEKARENIEVIRLYIRLTKDLKQLSVVKFIEINENIEFISKQLSHWQNSL